MSKIEEKNAARRAATRGKILSAATALFARKGLAGTGVQEIADMADLSVGMLYRHFKTKEDIYEALIEKAMTDMNNFIVLLEGDISPVYLIKMAASNILEKIEKDNEYALFQKLLTRASDDFLIAMPQSMAESLFKRTQNYIDKISRLIERGQDDGTFRQGCAEGMTQLFIAALQGLAAWRLAIEDKYVSPSPQMLTAFLLKDEYNVYEDEIQD